MLDRRAGGGRRSLRFPVLLEGESGLEVLMDSGLSRRGKMGCELRLIFSDLLSLWGSWRGVGAACGTIRIKEGWNLFYDSMKVKR